MKSETRSYLLSVLFLFCFCGVGQIGAAADGRPFFQSPSGERPATIDAKKGLFILPNGRILTPAGVNVVLPPHPYGLAITHDGKTAISLQTTNKPYFISVVENFESKKPKLKTITSDKINISGAFMGMAVSSDDKTLFVSTGNEGRIAVVNLADMTLRTKIDLNGKFGDGVFEDAYVGDIALSPDGKRLYVVDQANFRVAAIDTDSSAVAANYKVGRYPFGISVSPDGKRVYVVNSGMFQYSLVDGYDPGNSRKTGLPFPAFGFPSKEAEEGTTVGKLKVKGLGDPNVPESFSLWAIDVAGGGKTVYRVKTGPLVGESINGYKAVGGSSPTAVLATEKYVFVSNEHTDTIAVFNAETGEKVRDISLTPTPSLGNLKGVMPFGLAVSPDGSRMYVAESGINAVAVIDMKEFAVIGHIPVCWFPAIVKVSPDGKRLFVVNAKGYGSGPNAGPKFINSVDTYVGRLMKGTLSIIDIPGDDKLKEKTEQVLNNNGFIESPAPAETGPVPRVPGSPSKQIKYVVFITKENRTYDEVFGDLKYDNGQKVEGMPSLARFGLKATVSNTDTKQIINDVSVTPNHHALVYKYGVSDNFYMDSDVSADGHRWLTGTYANEYLETNTSASYSGVRDQRIKSSAPGRPVVTGSDSAIEPEDYLEAGSIWENLDRNGVRFRNWGEGFELAGAQENEGLEPTGVRLPLNIPMPKALFDNTSREFPTFNTGVTDKYRADQFIKEFKKLYVDGKEEMPSFINIYLPNDHTSSPRPDAGYPYIASYVADNDLALGRVVDFLSKTRYWANMAIFVTEDDAQGGIDHIDAHRSVLIVAGPYVKKGYVSHVHTSVSSIIKTFDLILGMPYLNQYDAAANDLSDFFTATPDIAPFNFLESDKRVFDPDKLKSTKSIYKYMQSAPLDDQEFLEQEHKERIEQEKLIKQNSKDEG